MEDYRLWNLASARLRGFAATLPQWVREEHVEQYHSILADFEKASGENLSAFRIPSDKLKPRVRSPFGAEDSGQSSKEKYCDTRYFRGQVYGLTSYLQSLRSEIMDYRPSVPFEAGNRADVPESYSQLTEGVEKRTGQNEFGSQSEDVLGSY